VQDKFTLRMSVENVFDTKPPFPSPAGGGVIADWQGVLGRYFKVGASAAFCASADCCTKRGAGER